MYPECQSRLFEVHRIMWKQSLPGLPEWQLVLIVSTFCGMAGKPGSKPAGSRRFKYVDVLIADYFSRVYPNGAQSNN